MCVYKSRTLLFIRPAFAGIQISTMDALLGAAQMKRTTVMKPECQKEAEDVYFHQHVCHSDVCPVLSGRARSCCHTVRKRKITFCQLSQAPGLLILCFQAIRAMSSAYPTLQPAGLTYLHLEFFDFYFLKKNRESSTELQVKTHESRNP